MSSDDETNKNITDGVPAGILQAAENVKNELVPDRSKKSLSLLIGFVELIKSHAKSDSLFGSLTLAIIITMMFYKIFIYLKNGIPYSFAEVMEEEKIHLKSDDEDIVETYLGQVAYFKWTISTQIMCTFFTVAVFIVSNIYKKINNSFKEGEVFMYEIWFPYDKNNYDTLISVLDVCMVSIGFFNNVAVASVPYTLMIYVSVELRILQIRIRKVFSSHETDDASVALKVKELIRKHQHIIEFLTKLNDGIKNVILIEYILDSVNVAAALLHIITAIILPFITKIALSYWMNSVVHLVIGLPTD
ncbi:unnamed protein product [Ceutorhynchus assimilis]|uniref:Uncharacterized protein n=1 Tax=Ceutorhynchus assimilis TaxID=467358 RepID=A0A9N9QLK5_9CUCU|nr:unnamed protein product [Ceutorhynchus assimilis]